MLTCVEPADRQRDAGGPLESEGEFAAERGVGGGWRELEREMGEGADWMEM